MIALIDETDVAADELERSGPPPADVGATARTRMPDTGLVAAAREVRERVVSERVAERPPPEIYLG